MSKINVYALERPEPRTLTRTWEENGVSLTLAFRELNAADLAMAAELAERLIRDFLTGNPDLGRPPAPFPYPDVPISKTLFNNAALAVQCQVADDPRHAYDEYEFLVMSVRLPRTWLEIQRLLQELYLGPPAPSRNGEGSPAPAMASSSAPR